MIVVRRRLFLLALSLEILVQDTSFWRLIALLAVFALFYVGHGLHRGTSVDLASPQAAHADGILTREGKNAILTSNADGTQINVWRQTGHYSVEHRSTAAAP